MTSNSKTRVATCMCRKLKVTAQGEPVRISVCHCLECQLRTGSVFGAQARFPTQSVQVDGKYNTHIRHVDDEDGCDRILYHFCPSCGSTVFYVIESNPSVTGIPIGAFADPSFPAPKFSVYEARKHSWVEIPGNVEHLD